MQNSIVKDVKRTLIIICSDEYVVNCRTQKKKDMIFHPFGGRGAAKKKEGGSSNSLKFHRPDCKWAQRGTDKNKVEFKSKLAANPIL